MAGTSPNPLSEHDTFSNLILVACEDHQIREGLLGILALPAADRIVTLTRFIHKMRQQGAPGDLIEAISFLKDEAVARQVLSMITTRRDT